MCTFHWKEADAADFDEDATREQLRDYLAVLDLLAEYKADCLGWQYQLGLLPLRPPSDFAEGLFNSTCRPESNGDTVACATEADQGNAVPMEMLKRLLAAKGLHQAVMFHDVRWGAEHDGRFLWVLLNSGSCGAYAFNHDPSTLAGVHSYRQPAGYFPVPGGTFAGESLPGVITWARAYLKANELWMDVGRGEVVRLPPDRARRLVGRHHAAVAVHGGGSRRLPRRPDGALSVEPRGRRLRRRLRRDGRTQPGAGLQAEDPDFESMISAAAPSLVKMGDP